MEHHQDIRIGTIVNAVDGADYVKQILPHGFESFEISFWQNLQNVDLASLATELKDCLESAGNRAVVSSLGLYSNPLVNDESVRAWEQLIDNCALFGCNLVCGFAGRIVNKPVPESMPKFKQVFGELAKRARDNGVRIAFENCDMGGTWEYGDWNIAHSPHAWEMMFHELPEDNLGLEWEPCHQLNSLVEPLPQLRRWVGKVFHVHGKDATVLHDVLREHGTRGGMPYVYHRTPGFGDSNWSDIITILRQGGFQGAIDIEGWHDPVYRGVLEMTGQVHGLNYLKQCRGGGFVPNPT